MSTPARTTVAISLKMYFSHARSVDYCRELAALAAADEGVQTGTTGLVVLPTFVAVPAVLAAVHGTRMCVGAQDLATKDSGPYTGEVSGAVLAEIGCTHVVVGHAERRTEFGETEAVVAAKTRAAFRNGLVPILCVGEPERADPAAAADSCARQVRSAVPERGGAAAAPLIVAYEPYWAIGASQPAPTAYVAEVCQRLRTTLRDHLEDAAIIYGGSAGPGLLPDLGGSVDGLFLGRFAHDLRAVAGVLTEAASEPTRGASSITPVKRPVL